MIYPATRILDLDGTVIRHCPPELWADGFVVLPGVREALGRWWRAGEHIVIMTARPESQRSYIAAQLLELSLPYHQLMVGVTSGVRYLYNDMKTEGNVRETAIAINVGRNEGMLDGCTHPREFLIKSIDSQDQKLRIFCKRCKQEVEQ